jgi:integrase
MARPPKPYYTRDLLLVYATTGIRPSELRTVRIDEFDRQNRQSVLWQHKVVHRTGKPKVVPLATEAVYRSNARR